MSAPGPGGRPPGESTPGLHHVTAICGDAQATVDFYVSVLGLRLLKRTVNFDDPGTYHLYFGDEVGHPGTALTFFAWGGLPPGTQGAGQAVEIGFRVPAGSLGAWRERLEAAGVRVAGRTERFGRAVLPFRDPEGLGLALVEHEEVDPARQWTGGGVHPEMAVAGFHGVSLLVTADEPTAAVLGDVLGMGEEESGGGRSRWAPPSATSSGSAGSVRNVGASGSAAAPASEVELIRAPGSPPGRVARGSVHHVAFRAADLEHQDRLRSRAIEGGLAPTPVIDRYYFRSVYFREPGGVLFEVATDGPGFTRDQEPDELGRGLTLPPWLESRRAQIEAGLPPVRAPGE